MIIGGALIGGVFVGLFFAVIAAHLEMPATPDHEYFRDRRVDRVRMALVRGDISMEEAANIIELLNSK